MQNLTPQGQVVINDIARRYNLSLDAVIHMLGAVNNGGGGMAQFNCPELGGSGQWMSGGMTMVGDMFNNGLKNTVDNLCCELANALVNNQMYPAAPQGTQASNQWWPQELGNPFSSGAQNNTRYAIFPQRLAIDNNGDVKIYDTLDHQIGGVSQQQGGNDSVTFNSQFGAFSVDSLPLLNGKNNTAQAPHINNNTTPPAPAQDTPVQSEANQTTPSQNTPQNTQSNNAQNNQSANDILGLIEKLAHLRDAGALTDDEYHNKKSDLLSRL